MPFGRLALTEVLSSLFCPVTVTLRRPMNRLLRVILFSACSLTACGVTPSADVTASSPVAYAIASYATRPELADAESQAILRSYADEPTLLLALQVAYGERSALQRAESSRVHMQGLEEDRLAYIQWVTWGRVSAYDGEYGRYSSGGGPYPGINWERNGCSAPDGLGLSYREDFRSACNLHDFGYHNFGQWAPTDQNRRATDDNFHKNMDILCDQKSWAKRPACYSASFAYYAAVRAAGGPVFTP